MLHFLYYSCPVLLQAAVEAISLAEKMGLADTPEGYTTMMNDKLSARKDFIDFYFNQ